MSYLVDECVLDSGDKVIIRWTDGTEQKAVYKDTYGYNHFFDTIPPSDKEIRLSNIHKPFGLCEYLSHYNLESYILHQL